MSNIKKIPIGEKFNKLTVLEDAGYVEYKSGKRGRMVRCVCDCGEIVERLIINVKTGVTKSCGCLKHKYRDIKDRRFYKESMFRFNRMMSRCYNPSDKSYSDYGGRGILICDEWVNNFRAFYMWVLISGYKSGMEIDRINNDEGYSPENCRWATRSQNARNTRVNSYIEVNGAKRLLLDWADITGINYSTLQNRVHRGWSNERVLSK